MSRAHYDEIGQQFEEKHASTMGQMFGKPCLKSGGKAFAAFFNGEMVFKLGQQEVIQLIKKYPGSVNWDPSGKKRPMKDWLQVPADFKDDWTTLAEQALDYARKKE